MSPLFISQFKKANKCGQCGTLRLANYSLCTTHLKKAKVKWRSWAEVRRAKKKCCYCNRPSFCGYLRCKKHTEYNRSICKAWVIENKDYKAAYDKQRRKGWAKLGKCYKCVQHRPIYKTSTRECLTCLKRTR